ncbi:MAG: DUF4860 domain-containing protein [Blautia sp.]|nr:DUF4860 domain-containing protein [Blautia sp.]
MNDRRHSILSLASLLLFFMFVLFTLPVLIESAQAYRASVNGQDQNINLYTAENYIITRFRQFDHAGDSVQIRSLGDSQALVFTDMLDGQPYETSLYLLGSEFRELFTQKGSDADIQMGTTLAELAAFDVRQDDSGLIVVELEDLHQNRASFVLHPGPA